MSPVMRAFDDGANLSNGAPHNRTNRLHSCCAGDILPYNWLRVLCCAEASRMGHGGRQPLHTRPVRSEKCVLLRGRAWTGMRVIAVFFGPCTPYVRIAHISVFPHYFKRLDRFTKLATSSRSRSTFSWRSFLSFFAFKAGMLDTP